MDDTTPERGEFIQSLRDNGWWLALLVPAAVALWLRPLIPPVETRYINVAWEMWSQGHFLVPVLNTESYSDKPPLFFWMIHLGWAIFGVNEWWPRSIPALLVVLNTGLTAALAARLWPGDRRTASFAAWMLTGTLAWLVFGIALMFDILLTTWVLTALLALCEAARTGRRRWHALYAVSIALGVLSKGPVILLHVLPVALFAPWWLGPEVDRRTWYRRTALAILGGLLLTAVWVVPAAIFGGDVYREKILWRQTAGRVSDSFAHARAWWYYLIVFPLLALPWVMWPRVWGGVRRLFQAGDQGMRFLLSGLVPTFLCFSAVSGKQIHYLLPWLPGAILLAAAAVRVGTKGVAAIRVTVPAIFWMALPIVAAMVVVSRAGGASAVSMEWAVGCGLLAFIVVVAAALRPAEPLAAIRRLALAASASLTLLLVVFGTSPLAQRYDVKPAARLIAAAVARGSPLASTSAYNGEFGFDARLAVPVVDIGEDGVAAWCGTNPTGLVMNRRPEPLPPRADAVPLYSAPYRGGILRLWSCSPPSGG